MLYAAGLAALIGCQDQPAQPSQGSYEQNLQSCLEELDGFTSGYTGNFTNDFTANVMRPYGANIDLSNEGFACTAYKGGFTRIENPDNKALTVGEGPVVMLGEDDVTSTYRDLVLGEADTLRIVSSYLDAEDTTHTDENLEWAREFVRGPIDQYVCENGTSFWHPSSDHPETRRDLWVSVPMKGPGRKDIPRSVEYLVTGKYGVENPSEHVEDMYTILGWSNAGENFYSFKVEDRCEETQ